MAKTNITLYSSTPSSNTDINNINIDENCPASGLNNAIRELMAHLKNVDTGSQALTALSVTGDLTVDTNTLFVDSANNRVGIGTSSPLSTLHVNGSILADANTGNGYGFERSGVKRTVLELSRIGADIISLINPLNNHLVFGTNDTERMRIDSSGNLLVGTTDTAPTADGETGFVARASGYVIAGMNNQQVMLLNRSGTDGDILQFRKSGTTVGSIGNVGSYLQIDTYSYSGLFLGSGAVFPKNNGSLADNVTSLGSSSYRFKDLYLSGGVVFGSTGGSVTSKTLDDYEEGTFDPVLADAQTGGNLATFGAKEGIYTKIGRQVTCRISITNINTTGMTGSNTLWLRDLPFTVSKGLTAITRLDNWNFNDTGWVVFETAGSATGRFFNIIDNTSDAILTVDAINSGSADCAIHLTYFV